MKRGGVYNPFCKLFFFHESNHKNKTKREDLSYTKTCLFIAYTIYFIRHKCSIHKISMGHREINPNIFTVLHVYNTQHMC